MPLRSKRRAGYLLLMIPKVTPNANEVGGLESSLGISQSCFVANG